MVSEASQFDGHSIRRTLEMRRRDVHTPLKLFRLIRFGMFGSPRSQRFPGITLARTLPGIERSTVNEVTQVGNVKR